MKERDLKEKCYMEALDGSISNVIKLECKGCIESYEKD